MVPIQDLADTMNKKTRTIIFAVLFLFAPMAFACDYPSRPADLPDGATASQDEMFVGVKAINAYQDAMKAYLKCIEADEIVAVTGMDDVDAEAKGKRSAMFDKKYNAAVEEMTLVVEEFNAQIRAYKQQSN